MLHALSTAALERAQTRDSREGGCGLEFGATSHTATQSLSDLTDSDSEEEEEITCCFRLGLCIGYVIPSWGHLSIANVGRSWAAGAFALWHCYVFLSSAVLIYVNCTAALLRCYIQWFSQVSMAYGFEGICCFVSTTTVLGFLGVALRSYLLISTTSDLLRFAYLLCKDAWRPDAFEAYRRLLVGDAWRELEAGEFYTHSWSVSLGRWQRTFDVIFQCLLHFSLDIVPICTLVGCIFMTHLSEISFCELCFFIGLFHILAFYFLWLVGEVSLKVFNLRHAWQVARGRGTRHSRPIVDTWDIWVSPSDLPIEAPFPTFPTEKRSICVFCGTIFHWLEYLMPSVLGLVTFIVGLIVHHLHLAILGAGFGLAAFIMLLVSLQKPTELSESEATDFEEQKLCRRPVVPAFIYRVLLYPDALQYWGERWCRLSFLQQKRQRFFFTLTLTLSSIVFAAFRFTGLSVACVFVVLINFLRLLWMRVEGPIGWLWAILEAVVEFIVLSYVIIATARNKFQDAAIVLLLSLMRQFGFQREICAGERVRLATMMVLGITNVLFLILVCFAVTSFWEDEDWSAFGHAMNETKFYAIPTYSSNQSYTPLPLCRLRFPIGTELETPEQSSLSLADFGLMASLTYEPSSRVREGLRHYFPKWRLETKPESARYIDWVRFLMLTSEDNSTTVIAVRGTLDFLDALQDVSLWLVPALMQTLDFVGPDISSGAWGESVAELSTLVPLSMISAERSFSSVLAATEFMMKAFPERLFYITGHSLGGGVAKLVSLKLSATETTTIAFSAPGIRHAARVLFGEWAPQPKALDRGNSHGFARRLFRLLTRDLHKKLNQDSLSTITVKPEHDIISRIDLDRGNAIVTPCDERAYRCHSAMLRSLSHAAIEHAHTRDSAWTDPHTGISGISSLADEIDEFDESDAEEEKMTCCFRIGLCIGYMIPTWGHLSIANVGRSWAAGACALWHCYMFFSAALLIFYNCAATFLRCYIQWFSGISLHLMSWRICCHFVYETFLHFFGTLVRCYIVLTVGSDVLRFAYLLCKDAWRPDAFEAYRRLLVGDAWRELEAGEFYTHSWSVSLGRWQRTFDVIFQCLLHFSLDIAPLCLLVACMLSNDITRVFVCKVCLAIGGFHVLVFYFLWLGGEVYLKVMSFARAWKMARGGTRPPRIAMPMMPDTGSLWMTPEGMQFASTEKRSSAFHNKFSFVWETRMPKGAQDVFPASKKQDRSANPNNDEEEQACKDRVPAFVLRAFTYPEALQDWGEKWCRLGYTAQKRQRYSFLIMLAVSGTVFGAFRFAFLSLACLFLVLVAFFRLLWMRVEGPAGWLWAFLEAFVEFILLNYVIIATAKDKFQDAAVIFLLSLMRQFGFQREVVGGERVRIAAMNVLGIIHFLLVILVCFALESFWEDYDWSAFAPVMSETKYYPISRYPLESKTPLPLCLLRFPMGTSKLGAPESTPLSLGDFGLMASLTYETSSRAQQALEHYFAVSEWRIERRPETDMDWVRFLMFTSSDNSTTVITVRGTMDFLDVLQDVALWLVPALMQAMNFVGPDVSSGAWGQAISSLSRLIPLSTVNTERSFSSVLAATEFMIKSHPERLFYLAGHSLGGGVAKLVALKLSAAGLQKGILL
ncbi:unnamed protein product [Durusdinium trenchii]|uniref:Fungal lipase-type domain-containing protein n=1 Tax=Durusdinium trenchii TaxID=1381693 RepID=A0ABP0QK85_9DINO